jgi:Family of unknown function (DUF6518)
VTQQLTAERHLPTEGQLARPPAARPALQIAVVLAVGIGIGVLTSLLQKPLSAPWDALANSASPWLLGAFVAGAFQRGPARAAIAGLLTCTLELVGYYVTAGLHGYSAGGGILVFWAVCAVLGGPVFGAAGWIWWRRPARAVGLGTAVMASAFVVEGVMSYAVRLHYPSRAVLFVVIGLLSFGLLGIRDGRPARATKWLVAVVPLGVAAELALDLLYRQSF